MILELPYPPTINNYYTVARGRKVLSTRGRQYREQVGKRLLFQKYVPWAATARLKVRIELFPPDKRKRDIDNPIKAILDALQHNGVYPDDNQIDKLTIFRRRVITSGLVSLQIDRLT